MTTFEIGNFSKDKAEKIAKTLNGKTYMNFEASWGIMPGGCPVSVSTNYDATEKEFAEMAMFVIASELA